MIVNINQRQKAIKQNIEDYKQSNQWEDAMKSDIRFRTLDEIKLDLISAVS